MSIIIQMYAFTRFDNMLRWIINSSISSLLRENIDLSDVFYRLVTGNVLFNLFELSCTVSSYLLIYIINWNLDLSLCNRRRKINILTETSCIILFIDYYIDIFLKLISFDISKKDIYIYIYNIIRTFLFVIISIVF